ncbi:GTPase RsgA [Streptomyces sp. NPDC048560]|uniref:GTPase RsgA n=1 Tax=Streptomyces sp. NPDC048560 TaxID=3155488 RepID=UPI00341465F1
MDSGATPVVVLTEADRCAAPVSAVSEVAVVAAGVAVLITRTTTGQGMDVLTPGLSGTVLLLGPSGADKSTLGNRLLGDFPATGPVRDRDGKGGPTTTWRELLPLTHGGVLPDTPGLRGVDLHDADKGPDHPFAEITRQARDRRFADGAHTSEPGCAALSAAENGHLTRRHLDGYHRLRREITYAASRTDARLRAELAPPKKHGALLRRAIKQSPNSTA